MSQFGHERSSITISGSGQSPALRVCYRRFLDQLLLIHNQIYRAKNMLRALKVFLAVVIAVILFTVLKFSWAVFSAYNNSKPSEIANFSPTSFTAKASTPFFYSVRADLKYSDEIRIDAPTLLSGQIKGFLVSPDNQKIAVVANGTLVVVSFDGEMRREVARVGSIYVEPKPMGAQFFRDSDFQWAPDSKSLYIIKDEYYQSKGSQLFSAKGELWKYDLDTAAFQSVVKPFPAHSYFFGSNSGIYFSVPDGSGNLQLKYFDGHDARDIGKPGAGEIVLDQLAPDSRKTVFFSFAIHDYEQAILPRKHVRLVGKGGGIQELVINNKSVLALTLGQGIKGPYFGSEMLRSVFLPGDNYFLFNVNCGNHQGQLLIDIATGGYMTLPKDTRVYLASNTNTFDNFQISDSGLTVIRAQRSPASN
jgi:hypothetical protein